MLNFESLPPANNGTDLTWTVLVALLTIVVNVVALVVQWRKDVKEAQLKKDQNHSTADQALLDQYQEELKECREDRVNFRKERSEWEKERDELVTRIRKLEAEKAELSLRLSELSLTNKRLDGEVADLKKRLQAALEG